MSSLWRGLEKMTDMSWKAPKTAIPVRLDEVKGEFRRGTIIALLFFGGLLGWAALTPLDAGAVASGIVSVSGSRQVVQHREGGIVTGINVVEGQSVKKGDLLAQISSSELIGTERGLTGEEISLLAQRARLLAEQGHAGSVADPAEFRALSGGDRRLAQDAMSGQRQLFYARQRSMSSEKAVLAKRTSQFSAQIGGYALQMDANREQSRLIGDEVSGLRTLEAKGFASTNRIRAMERAASELHGTYGALQAETARANATIGETQMQVVSMERKMLEDVATQLRDVQFRLDEVQPKLLAVREQLGRSMVRAPANGKIVGLDIHTVGGVVGPGQTLMEIVPQDRALVIVARAAPTDADDLKIGMKTQVRFSALQDRNLPVLYGKISKLSADSIEDTRTGARYFEIEVIVPTLELDKIKKARGETGLKAGLPADVMVPLRKRTALNYLIEPLTQMLWMAGREH
jgi:HlyD family type I secretion membrane fusion protein